MVLGILTAMTSEFELLAALLEDRSDESKDGFNYTIGRKGVDILVLRQCGIGKVNAAVGTAELIRSFHPDCVISTGVAGGIDKSLAVMDVVVSSQIVYHDVWCGMGCEYGQIQGMPAIFEADSSLVKAATAIKSCTKIHKGLICTGDQFITSGEELAKIKEKFPDGLAVDMESASIAQTCHIYGVPFVSFRIISDTPGIKGHIDQYENFWGEMANRSFGVTKDFIEKVLSRE